MNLQKMIDVLKSLETKHSLTKTLYIDNECKVSKLLGKLEEQDRILKIIISYKSDFCETESFKILFARMIKEIELEYFTNKSELDSIIKE